MPPPRQVFETTIRVVGGLLGAYTLSKDKMFLDKACPHGHGCIGPGLLVVVTPASVQGLEEDLCPLADLTVRPLRPRRS